MNPSIVSADTAFEVEFPCGYLNYDPFIPKKRSVTKQTSTGSFTQISSPMFLNGQETIDWNVKFASQDLAFRLRDAYNLPEYFAFTGVWGESMFVEFKEFTMTSKSGFFELNGKFRVICVSAYAFSQCTAAP